MAESSNPTENRHRWFWRFTLLAFALALAVGAFLWRILETAAILDIQSRLEGLKPTFTGIRWLLIGLIAGCWPAITNGLTRVGRIDSAGKVQLLALRWRVLPWLVVLELMLGQNLPGHFLRAIHGVEA